MALPDPLLLPPPRQPTPEVRAGTAYRAFSATFVVLLTVAILLFLAPFLGPSPRWHAPLWIAAGAVILLTAPLRAWGLRRGLLSYFVHGIAVEGTVAAVDADGEGAWVVRVRYDGEGLPVERPFRVVDAPAAPLRVGDRVPVLHRPGRPVDAVLPTLAGLLPA